MKDAETKRPVYLSDKELGYIEHILYHFTDYMGGDDRPDHGWGILKDYRDIDEADKYFIMMMAGRLRRIYRGWREKRQGNG